MHKFSLILGIQRDNLQTDGRRALQVKERQISTHVKGAYQDLNLLIFWFNVADILDQISDHCIDFQHIFDCRCFLLIFNKSSISLSLSLSLSIYIYIYMFNQI